MFPHFSKQILLLLLFAASLITACSSTKNIKPANTTAPTIDDTSQVENVIAPATPTYNWHLLESNGPDRFSGISSQRAYDDFLLARTPKKNVVVAIIDSGTDIFHEDLDDNIWENDDEILDNNIDDDGNGYTDDIYGWNFIGGPDSAHVVDDTYELTRIYRNLNEKFSGITPDTLTGKHAEEYEYYLEIKAAYEKDIQSKREQVQQLQQIAMAVSLAKRTLEVEHVDSVSTEEIQVGANDNQGIAQAKQVLGFLKQSGFTEQDVKDELKRLQEALQRSTNPGLDTRYIVGDDYEDLSDRFYGNNDVVGPFADHGTHVAGIVGAERDNGVGMNGIADYVKLMIVKTVPNGDERDKDVANAIRYAAENGADIINMSFGKSYSPEKDYVDEAVKFADSLGVLMISGAGNSSKKITKNNSFPNKYYLDGSGEAKHWITVGASSWRGDSLLAAPFSNYSSTQVDVFAPGTAIYSTVPNNKYEKFDGTSMASPVTAGIAAILMAYYPDLATATVKDVILESVTDVSGQMVIKPGSQTELVPFGELSVTGGIVNLYNALKLADEIMLSKTN